MVGKCNVASSTSSTMSSTATMGFTTMSSTRMSKSSTMSSTATKTSYFFYLCNLNFESKPHLIATNNDYIINSKFCQLSVFHIFAYIPDTKDEGDVNIRMI